MPKKDFVELEEYIKNERKKGFDDVEYSDDINKYCSRKIFEHTRRGIRTSCSEQYTLLHVAIKAGNKPAIEWLLNQKANPELPKKVCESEFAMEYYQGDTPKTSEYNDVPCLELAAGNNAIIDLLSEALKARLAKKTAEGSPLSQHNVFLPGTKKASATAGANPSSRLNIITKDSKKASATAGASASSDTSAANVGATPKSTIN